MHTRQHRPLPAYRSHAHFNHHLLMDFVRALFPWVCAHRTKEIQLSCPSARPSAKKNHLTRAHRRLSGTPPPALRTSASPHSVGSTPFFIRNYTHSFMDWLSATNTRRALRAQSCTHAKNVDKQQLNLLITVASRFFVGFLRAHAVVKPKELDPTNRQHKAGVRPLSPSHCGHKTIYEPLYMVWTKRATHTTHKAPHASWTQGAQPHGSTIRFEIPRRAHTHLIFTGSTVCLRIHLNIWCVHYSTYRCRSIIPFYSTIQCTRESAMWQWLRLHSNN